MKSFFGWDDYWEVLIKKFIHSELSSELLNSDMDPFSKYCPYEK